MMKSYLRFFVLLIVLFQYIELCKSFHGSFVKRIVQSRVGTIHLNRRKAYSKINRLQYKAQGNEEEDRRYFTSFDDSESGNERKSERKNSQKKENRPSFFIGKGAWKSLNKALFIGIFVAGIGTGVTLDSAINTNPKDLASRDAIDRNAPNPKLCTTYGASAMVLDQRVFVTFNPFNVYVTQADTKPGCVLRPANVVPLLQKERQLLTEDDVNSCKNGSNTWAFVGDINSEPQLSCVYQSDDAQNEFLSNPKVGLGEDIYEKSTSPTSPTK